MTVDLFSIYLLSRVDIVIRYIEVDFTFGLPDYVRYIEEFVISRFYSMHFIITYISFFISRTSLNGGSLNRGSSVHGVSSEKDVPKAQLFGRVTIRVSSVLSPAQSVKCLTARRAGGRGFNSRGRTNPKGLKIAEK